MKQVICYLYEHENNRQVRNVGFVKCMALQDKVVFQIHGKGLDCTKGRNLKMFFFSTKQGASEISEIGYVEGEEGIVNYRMTVEPMSLEQLEQYDGVYLESPDEMRYVATWNRSTLVLESTEELLQQTEVEAAIVQEVERHMKQVEMEISEEIVADIPVESDTIKEEKIEEVVEEAIGEVVDESIEEVQEELSYEKIDRQGLSVLPQREWRVANNSFLLHGYYNYKHLLFIREDNLLYLGVPGIYHAKEAEAAKSFGFPVFHRIEKGKLDLQTNEWNSEADFGYWCRQVAQKVNT